MFHPWNFNLNQAFNIGEILFIAWCANHHGGAKLACATCAANPVYIVFRMAGHVIVEHVAHIGHIQPAGRYVGGHQKAQYA